MIETTASYQRFQNNFTKFGNQGEKYGKHKSKWSRITQNWFSEETEIRHIAILSLSLPCREFMFKYMVLFKIKVKLNILKRSALKTQEISIEVFDYKRSLYNFFRSNMHRRVWQRPWFICTLRMPSMQLRDRVP